MTWKAAGPGRSKGWAVYTKQVNLKLRPSTLRNIEAAAKANRLTRMAMIRVLIERGLALGW